MSGRTFVGLGYLPDVRFLRIVSQKAGSIQTVRLRSFGAVETVVYSLPARTGCGGMPNSTFISWAEHDWD